ncbi:hypothetical protein [Hydrocarboniphaga sp.]|uniref:hypothetical protein n=1 Tax=Hydrocarboniphaga sp. TaxID=2033016 RepID=UPI003D1467C7
MILPVTHWLLMSLRHRAVVLPSCANPRIASGGLVGEGKTEYFASMGERARAATARNGSFVVQAASIDADASACMQQAGIAFPIIAKPDIGWCGFGVRRIDDRQQLRDYLGAFPKGERVLLQAYVADAGEAGVFYVREPGAVQGRVLGVALRYFPQVTGDGVHTLAELIAGDTRLQRLHDPLHRSRVDLSRVAAAGEVVRLATIGSTRVGGLYRDGQALITPQLGAAIDAIARDMDEFHFGRFDLRYASEAALMRGEGFTIIEVNGAGSEAIEAWDPATRPLAAMRKIMAKQALLFRIAAANRRRGFRPLGLRALARLHFNQQRLIRLYPPSN